MNPPEIGKLITEELPRDAIHIAVAPVTNGSIGYLQPGQALRFSTPGNVEMVIASGWVDAVGIVDPFLRTRVEKGASFWMFLKPNTITSLRHDWTHPVFDGNKKGIAEWWMRDFMEKQNFDFTLDDLLAQAKKGEVYSGNDLNYEELDEAGMQKFWDNYEILTGHKVPVEDRTQNIFRCAC